MGSILQGLQGSRSTKELPQQTLELPSLYWHDPTSPLSPAWQTGANYETLQQPDIDLPNLLALMLTGGFAAGPMAGAKAGLGGLGQDIAFTGLGNLLSMGETKPIKKIGPITEWLSNWERDPRLQGLGDPNIGEAAFGKPSEIPSKPTGSLPFGKNYTHFLQSPPTNSLSLFPRLPLNTEALNPKAGLSVNIGKDPEWMYHGLGVEDWDIGSSSKGALVDQAETKLPSIAKEGLRSGWFSDFPLAGYGPVHLAVKYEDLPKVGTWENPSAEKFKSAGEAMFKTYRPWQRPSDLYPVERLDWEEPGPIPPEKIYVADKGGNIIGPLIDKETGEIHPKIHSYLKAIGGKITELLRKAPFEP